MYNDAVLANKVREAILLNPRVSAQDIFVSCRDRVVTLAGDVDTPEQRAEAEEAAFGVEGVTHVINDMVVRPGRWPPAEMEILPWTKGTQP
ncbi:MAG: BON domain-containing protein [Armatimonadota bacterium]